MAGNRKPNRKDRRQKPKDKQAHLLIGLTLHRQGRVAEAVLHYEKARKQKPKDPRPLYFLSLCAYQMRERERAVRLMLACLKIAPGHPEAWYNLGKYYQDAGKESDAMACYVAALENKEDFPEALTNLGNLYMSCEDIEAAEACFARSLAANTDNPEALYNRSFIKLAKGDYEGGWREHEERWRCPAFFTEYRRPFMGGESGLPPWDGTAEGTVLVHAEQGNGDAIQFWRYVPMVAGITDVVVEVPKSLVRLASWTFPGIEIIARNDPISDRVTSHVSMMSLPFKVGTTTETVPPPIAVAPDGPELPPTSARRIGLVWAGTATHPNDHNRSIRLDKLAPLFSVKGCEWYSFQVGDRAYEGEAYPLIDLAPRIQDYGDTAKLLSQMDLVVAVDTSVAHLAGSLGVETWTLLPRVPDFRWMLDRVDTPWYPSMSLVRQTKRGDWDSVVRRVKAALEAGAQQEAA